VAMHKIGRTTKFPRDEHVDIVVREVLLNADAPESARVPTIEIREYIKSSEMFGHGLVIPARSTRDLQVALDLITRED
jgi:hypothetical protein